MRTAGVSKTAVWRWQARFMEEGVDGLLRDKTRRCACNYPLTRIRQYQAQSNEPGAFFAGQS
jgi:hypothetical protein